MTSSPSSSTSPDSEGGSPPRPRPRPRLGVFKLASCDGCQLTLLDCEDELLELAAAVEIVHFAELSSQLAPRGPFDLVLVEGSVSTPEQALMIRDIRASTRRLVTLGACATAGGIQSLRNFADHREYLRIVYATPDYIETLSTATPVSHHVPVDFELYLPTSWAGDPDRRAEARIPDDVVFQTKPQLALAMLRRAVEANLRRGTVLADEGYGNAAEFRTGCRKLGLDYAVAVSATTRVWLVDALSRRHGDPLAARELAQRLAADRGFRRYTWREGTAAPLSARFAFMRVVPAADDGSEPRRRDRVWLVCEWRDGDDAPRHFHLATYKRMPFVQLVHLLKERWRTERVYQDLKGELGLDHFEGRRFRGWHHHVSVALCCFAFLAAERARASPPSAAVTEDHDPVALAA